MGFDKINSIFFVGIGGIGMSALARYFKLKGKKIYGYDRVSTALTRTLEAEGMEICYIESEEYFPDDLDLMIKTPAVSANNLFLNIAEGRGVAILKRAAVLGQISSAFRGIAVAGTHGKTTTSSMIAWVLRYCGLDCSAFLGGIAVNFDSNFVYGSSDLIVLEADEYDRSFLSLEPEIAVITSIEADHLDIYGQEDMVLEAYIDFARKIKSGGSLIVNSAFADLINVEDIQKITYGFDPVADYNVSSMWVEGGKMQFEVQEKVGSFQYRLGYAGKHNVENACAAIAVARHLGLYPEQIASALDAFNGIRRRFEIIIQQDDLAIIDDYAHHPTELKAAIAAARLLFPGKKITGVFQPHLYSRTRDFCDGFAEALDGLDECLLVDLYPAREDAIPGVSSAMILDKMRVQKKSICALEDVPWRLLQMDIEVLLIMGAGNIDTALPKIKEVLVK